MESKYIWPFTICNHLTQQFVQLSNTIHWAVICLDRWKWARAINTKLISLWTIWIRKIYGVLRTHIPLIAKLNYFWGRTGYGCIFTNFDQTHDHDCLNCFIVHKIVFLSVILNSFTSFSKDLYQFCQYWKIASSFHI